MSSASAAEYALHLQRDPELAASSRAAKYQATGTAASMAANRISYFFDLHGPSLTLDTACSSTMVALDLAVRRLQQQGSGGGGLAIVCGANLVLAGETTAALARLGFLAADGRCKSFDAAADGYARGEGVLALVLKPLVAALRDGDPVRAVVKGTRVNQDGRTAGITAPSEAAQLANLRGVLAESGVDARSVGYLEAHGAGTRAGDAAELAAVNAAFFPDTDPGIVNTGTGITSTNAGVSGTDSGIGSDIDTDAGISNTDTGISSGTVSDTNTDTEISSTDTDISSDTDTDAGIVSDTNTDTGISSTDSGISRRRLVVGSVKASIGHLEACAGLVGLVKTVEALDRGAIPPQRHLAALSPRLDVAHITIAAGAAPLPWPPARRRAAVNSFGFGGTNGVAVLDAAHPYLAAYEAGDSNDGDDGDGGDRPYLFRISAQSPASLRAQAARYAEFLQTTTPLPPLADLAYTLLARRSTLRFSRFVVADSHAALAATLQRAAAVDGGPPPPPTVARPGLCFVFTGQGAQWAGMGARLAQQQPAFRRALAACDHALAELPDRPQLSVVAELQRIAAAAAAAADTDIDTDTDTDTDAAAAAAAAEERVHDAAVAQPLCTALQIALVAFWRSVGVAPAAVVGHSSGEIAAAHAAGILTLRDAMATSYYRGRAIALCRPPAGTEAMCAVALAARDAAALCASYGGRLALAAANSPRSSTLAGDRTAIAAVEAACRERGVFVRRLRGETAYHSPHHLAAAGPVYRALLEAAGVAPQPPGAAAVPIVSSVTGEALAPAHYTPAYWERNLLATVQFGPAVAHAVAELGGAFGGFLELGPHPALRGPVRETAGPGFAYFASLVRGADGFAAVLDTAGALLESGAVPQLNLAAVNGRRPRRRAVAGLPPYAWDHADQRFWAETRVGRRGRLCAERHALLGARLPTDSPRAPAWRCLLAVAEMPMLAAMTVGPPVHPVHSAHSVHSVHPVHLPIPSIPFHSARPVHSVHRIPSCPSIPTRPSSP